MTTQCVGLTCQLNHCSRARISAAAADIGAGLKVVGAESLHAIGDVALAGFGITRLDITGLDISVVVVRVVVIIVAAANTLGPIPTPTAA